MEMLLVIATIKEVLKTRGGLIEDFKATTRKKEDGRQAGVSSSAVPGATFVPEEIYKLAKIIVEIFGKEAKYEGRESF